MIPEAGQLWLDQYNGLYLLTDIVEYKNNIHKYKLYGFQESRIVEWLNPFSEVIPPNFTVFD